MSFLCNEPHFPLAGTLSSQQDAAPRPSAGKGRLPVCVFGEAQAIPFLIPLSPPPLRPSQDGRVGRTPLRSFSYNRFKSIQLETSLGGLGRLERRERRRDFWGWGWAWLLIAVDVTWGRPARGWHPGTRTSASPASTAVMPDCELDCGSFGLGRDVVGVALNCP